MNNLTITTSTTTDATNDATSTPFNTAATVYFNSYIENERTVGTTFETVHLLGQDDPTPCVAIIINEGSVDAIVGIDRTPTVFQTFALPAGAYFIAQQFASDFYPYDSLKVRAFTSTCKLKVILIS